MARYGASEMGRGHTSCQWEEFVSSLKCNGYFNDELEGSAHYQKLMKSALVYFEDMDVEERYSHGNGCHGNDTCLIVAVLC